jgi:hypothetical protein
MKVFAMANVEQNARIIQFISCEGGCLCSRLQIYILSKWESTPVKYVGTMLEYRTPYSCFWIYLNKTYFAGFFNKVVAGNAKSYLF